MRVPKLLLIAVGIACLLAYAYFQFHM